LKYRKKATVVVEAEQWNGFKPNEPDGQLIKHFHSTGIPKNEICEHCGRRMREHGHIGTLEGGHIVCVGDWIVTGVRGEHYPVKADIFAETYELVEDQGLLDDDGC
jgi:hypothetical protein